MSRWKSVAACAGLVLLLTGCGGSNGGGGKANGNGGGAGAPAGGPSSQPAGAGKTLWVVRGSSLTGLDANTGDVVVDTVQIGDIGSEVQAFVPTNDKVWLGLDDGKVIVVDAKTGTVAKTLSFDAGQYGIDQLVVGGGGAYLTYGGQGTPTVRLGPTAYDTEASKPIVASIDSCDAMMVDGGTLWVLQGNEFALIKADATTLAKQGSVVLGQDPGNPTGPFKNLYGYGTMVQVGGQVWIVDTYSHVLIRVDKASMKATRVADLKDLLGRDTAVRLVAVDDGFFLAASSDDAGKVVRYDANGQVLKTYDLGPGAARGIALAGKLLYATADDTGSDVLVVDVQSGRTVTTLRGVGADEIGLAP